MKKYFLAFIFAIGIMFCTVQNDAVVQAAEVEQSEAESGVRALVPDMLRPRPG